MTTAPAAAGPTLGAAAEDWMDAGVLLDRQTAVLELIAGAAPLREVLTEILASLQRLMQGASCSVLLLDRERGTLHHGAALDLPAAYVAAIDGLAARDGAGSCGTAAALNTAVVVGDVRLDPRWENFRLAAEDAGLRACWSTPIRGRDGLPVGTFAVYYAEPHTPTAREQRLVDRFTHLASVAIEHAGLIGDLIESEQRFRRSFDANSLGLAILATDRTLTSANDALRALAAGRTPGTGRTATGRTGTDRISTGTAGGGLLGRPLDAVLTPLGASLAERFADLDRDDAPATFEAVLHDTAGGEPVAVEVTVSVLRDREGHPGQYVVNVLDLTERRAAERDRRARAEAETARRTAEELLHEKSALLAAVGHEARTPIQAIVGFAELLGTIDLDESRRREALDHIGAAAGHVMDLLTDVLDLSRLEAGALTVAPEPVPLREVVAEVFGLLSSAAEARGTTLAHDLDGEVVLADRRRLRQVLLNLVGNAVRHGRAAGHVRVRPLPSAEPGVLLLAVEDDGPGIPPDLLPRIFQPFTRALPATGAASPGPAAGPAPLSEESIGLGLGLAHGLMAAMGGALSLGSSDETGTAMVLRVPTPTRTTPLLEGPPL